jgi:hypothetical protein
MWSKGHFRCQMLVEFSQMSESVFTFKQILVLFFFRCRPLGSVLKTPFSTEQIDYLSVNKHAGEVILFQWPTFRPEWPKNLAKRWQLWLRRGGVTKNVSYIDF